MSQRQEYQYGALGSLGLFGILALLAHFQFAVLTHADRWGLIRLRHHLTKAGIHRAHLWTTLGSPVIMGAAVILVAIACWGLGHHQLAAWLLTVLISSNAIAWLMKHLVARTRPVGAVYGDSGYSFPSGHVLNTMVLVLALMLIIRLWHPAGWLRGILDLGLILCVVAVMVSRVYLHAHFPSDVLASVLLAVGWWWQLQVWWPLPTATRGRHVAQGAISK